MGPCGSCWESFVPEVGPCGSCGESFVPEVAPRGCCWANNVVLWRSPRAGWWAMAAPWRRPRAPRPGRLDSPALHASAVVGLCAKEFALRAQNVPKLAFYGVLGEFCRGLSGGGAVPGESCRVCRPATVPGTVPGPTLPRPRRRLAAPPPYFAVPRHPHIGVGGGFALHEAFLRRVAGVSDPRVVQFPPRGRGAAAT